MRIIHLAIVNQQPIFLEGLCAMLSQIPDMDISATALTAEELFVNLKRGVADVLLTDIHFAEKDSLKIIPEIKRRYPGLKVIVLSSHKQPKLAKDVMDIGGDGFILYGTTQEHLVKGIHKVMNGETYFDGRLRIPVQHGEDIDFDQSFNIREEFLEKYNLSRREADIICLIADGKSNKEIAEICFVSEYTVKAHRRNIKIKLHLANTADIVRFAFETGLTMPENN